MLCRPLTRPLFALLPALYVLIGLDHMPVTWEPTRVAKRGAHRARRPAFAACPHTVTARGERGSSPLARWRTVLAFGPLARVFFYWSLLARSPRQGRTVRIPGVAQPAPHADSAACLVVLLVAWLIHPPAGRWSPRACWCHCDGCSPDRARGGRVVEARGRSCAGGFLLLGGAIRRRGWARSSLH